MSAPTLMWRLVLAAALTLPVVATAAAQSPAPPRIFFSTADDFLDEALTPPGAGAVPAPPQQPAPPQTPLAPQTPGFDPSRGTVRIVDGVPRFFPLPTVVRRPGDGHVPPETRPLSPAPPVVLGIQGNAVAGGVRVEFVERGSLAERMGLEAGDVIVSVHGRNVRDIAELRGALFSGAGRYQFVIRDVRTGNFVPAELPQ